jgi:hypothetical protein
MQHLICLYVILQRCSLDNVCNAMQHFISLHCTMEWGSYYMHCNTTANAIISLQNTNEQMFESTYVVCFLFIERLDLSCNAMHL